MGEVKMVICPACGGKKVLEVVGLYAKGTTNSFEMKCDRCDGEGEVEYSDIPEAR